MKVRATKKGFYGKIRVEGAVFILKPVKVKGKDGKLDKEASKLAYEAQFSDKWMERVRGKPGPRAAEVVDDDDPDDTDDTDNDTDDGPQG